jgi:hypothetical protein
MIKSIVNPRRRYQLVAISIFIVGMGSAVVIYLTAGSSDESALVSEFEESKRFMHDLELYGGKANVIANKFMHWFDGLWHGQSLAFTVAFLSVVISLGYFLVARHLEFHSASDVAIENDRSDIEGSR